MRAIAFARQVLGRGSATGKETMEPRDRSQRASYRRNLRAAWDLLPRERAMRIQIRGRYACAGLFGPCRPTDGLAMQSNHRHRPTRIPSRPAHGPVNLSMSARTSRRVFVYARRILGDATIGRRDPPLPTVRRGVPAERRAIRRRPIPKQIGSAGRASLTRRTRSRGRQSGTSRA